jgi:hypothetical protein
VLAQGHAPHSSRRRPLGGPWLPCRVGVSVRRYCGRWMQLVKRYWRLEINSPGRGWILIATVGGDTEAEAQRCALRHYSIRMMSYEWRLVPEQWRDARGP